MLSLDLAHRRRLEISSELLGLVHADVAVASTDDWRHDVGLCVACHQGVEGRP